MLSDKATGTHHTGTIANHQAVAAALVADVEITLIRPGRVRPRHQHAVAGGVISDIAKVIHHTTSITNHQTVAVTIRAYVEIFPITPSRVRSRHQHAIIGGGGLAADKTSISIYHTSTITNHQTVTAATIANVERQRIAPA